MAFPVVAATNSGNQATDATSHTINLPTGITAGDLLMIFISDDEGATITPPSGWTYLADSYSSSHGLAVLYKIATGSEGATATLTTASAQQSAHVTYRITGWHGTTPPEVATVLVGTTAPNPNSLDPSGWGVEDTLWIGVGAWDDGSTALSTYPANTPNNQITARAATATGVGIFAATANSTTASFNPDPSTLTANQPSKAYTIAVRPSTVISSPATFSIAAGADDGHFVSSQTANYSDLVYSSHLLSNSTVVVERFKGTNYQVLGGLLKFNTSSLPDTATITGATLRIYAMSTSNADSRNLVGEYYTWNGTSSDFSVAAPASPILSATLALLTLNATNDITFTNFSGISTTGTTSLRLHISGGAPTGDNFVSFASYEHTTNPEAQLIVTYTTNVAPTANFTYTPTNLSVGFTDTSTDPDGTIASRYWQFGDGATSTATNPSHTYATAGTYTTTLTVTDNGGATDSESKTFTVSPAAPPPDVTQGTGNSYLWKIFPKRTSTLTAGMDATQVTIPLADTTYWPQGGSVIVENEIMTYSGKSVINGAGNLTGVQRGQSGTTAATYSSGVEVGLLGRHSLGLLSKHKIPTFPSNGAITLNEQGRWQDKDWFVRCDFANYRELAELSIYAAPTSSGNVSTTLDEGGSAVTRNTAVTAAREVRSLTINVAPTTSGDVTVTLDGAINSASVFAAITDKVQIVWDGKGTSNDTSWTFYFYDASNVRQTKVVTLNAGQSATSWAAKLRGLTWSGWTLSGSGAVVTWTATTTGVRGEGYGGVDCGTGSNFMHWTKTWLAQGATGLTAIGVADLIRVTSFPGWTTGGTAGTATVTFTAVEPGVKSGTFSYSAGTTGATSTSGLTQTTAGSATSTTAVATAIRTTYSGNTYWSAGGSGAVVTFTALSDGAKQDATFTPGTTGTGGLMTTTRQGLPSVVAHIRDSSGVDDTRMVMANIATTTAFNIETSVSGSGTTKAVVSIRGSFGTDPLSLLWRKTEVDLSDHQAGYAAFGVVREFGSGITWDAHSDEIEPTSQAKTFHHDHTDSAEWIGQAHYYGRLEPVQSRNDLFIQGLSIPVIPGEEVVMAVKLRYENVPAELPAKPLFVTAHHADGTVTDLRDVTGTTGISGTAGWTEPTAYTFTVPTSPSPCYEIRVASRDMSSGTIVIQQLVVSPGILPKRTYYYATDGTVTVRYDGRTPQETNALRLGRQRVALETQYERPAGTLTSEQYRSADDENSFEDAWYPDPANVLDRPVVETEVTLEGDGLSTPKLLSGFPRFEYQLQVGLNPQPVLLKPDGTEFPGVAVLDKREEWYPATGYDIRQRPSGRFGRNKTHPPVGYIPKLSIGANRPEVVKLLNGSWGELILIADWVDDEVLTIGLLKNPELERTTITNGDGPFRWSVWKSKEIDAEVYSVRKRIRS